MLRINKVYKVAKIIFVIKVCDREKISDKKVKLKFVLMICDKKNKN